MGNRLVFEYAFAGDAAFDAVKAWRLGSAFNVPLKASYITSKPANLERSYFGVDQPNIQIVTVKPLAESSVRGEVSSAPLPPRQDKVFIIRLQEFAGKATSTKISLPAVVKKASLVSLTEDRELETIKQTDPLTVSIKPFQTLTIKVEVE